MVDVSNEAMLKDLELQWNDHFHMRDQTWKSLTNSVLLFIAVVGLELKDLDSIAMIPAYTVVMLTAIFGWIVATHHRLRQGQKFAMIIMYEEMLGLFELKKNVLTAAEEHKGIASKVFTAGFIRWMHAGLGLVALALLIRRVVLL